MKIWFFLCNWFLIFSGILFSGILFIIMRYRAYRSLTTDKRKPLIQRGLITATFFGFAAVALNIVSFAFLTDFVYSSLLILLATMALWFPSSLWSTPELITQQKRSLFLFASVLFIGGMLLSFALFLSILVTTQTPF